MVTFLFSSLLPFVLLSWLIDPHFCSLEEYSTSDFFTLTLLSLAVLKTFQAGVIVRQKHINESSLVLNEISLVLIGILEFISHQFCWFCCSVQLRYYYTNKLRHLLKIITLLNEKFYLTLPTCGGHTCWQDLRRPRPSWETQRTPTDMELMTTANTQKHGMRKG